MSNDTAARAVQLSELSAAGQAGPLLSGAGMDLIHNVKVRLSASVGESEVSVRQLLALKAGDLLELDRASHEPVELFLDGKRVGRGELVVVGEQFGVRILELGNGVAST